MASGTLPTLTGEYQIADAQIAQYRQQGHALLRGVCTREEVSAYRDAIRDACLRNAKDTRPIEERDTFGKAFLQSGNIWRQDAAVAAFVMAKRFGSVAARLMGVEGVRLYHDQALFKEPNGGPTPWHQDQYYWPLKCQTITMWMPLVDIDAEMGAMRFASGSHREGSIRSVAISDESEQFFNDYIAEKDYSVKEPVAMRAGDATFHNGWVLHAAPNNPTERMREVMTVIYYEHDATIAAPEHDDQRVDLETWFPGAQPGEPAATHLNPVIYSG